MDFFQKLSQILPLESSKWSASDFQLFLKHIHLEEYAPQFRNL